MMRGVVVKYFDRQGYGFVKPDHVSTKDVFFHASAVEGGESTIYVGAAVEYEPNTSERPAASKVRALGWPTAATPAPKKSVTAPTPTREPRKAVHPSELPPTVAKMLGLVEEHEPRRTKRDRLNSAHGR